MRWLRIRRPRLILPWGQPAGDLCIANRPLRDRQRRAAMACGMDLEGEADEPSEAPDALNWDEDLDLSVPMLRAFLKAARSGGRLCVVERPVRRGELIPEPEGPTYRASSSAEEEPTRRFGLRLGASEEPVIVTPVGLPVRRAAPQGQAVELFLTVRSAHTIRHWVHLLQANLSSILPELLGEVFFSPWGLAWTWLRAPWRAGVGRLARIGRGCDIHPTARLEGCVIGDHVTVGAYSVLRGCVVGAGATIEDHVSARASIIGPGAHLANWALCNFSVVGARASLGHIGCQASVIGEGAFVSSFAVLEDLSLTGNVRVRDGGQLRDAGSPFLGVAVGHRSLIAAQVTVAPGRAIPNDVRLLPDPAHVLTRIPDALSPGTWISRGGALHPAPPPALPAPAPSSDLP